ncbi:MAG: single-stranded-DNA-specific exonuclease RecJ [Oscillospiraceae bacterium]|nr:single-stranded-DNA-specific exonuclease RecJ [Oscillospiraceae bacterium]
MKYGTWNVAVPEPASVDLLQGAGYSSLTARVLCARGYDTPQKAEALLDGLCPLLDPYEMKDMDKAVAAIRQALRLGQRIAIFGDYDVDGITATCLLTDYLRSVGADCTCHIPGRMEEGYGLNAMAIEQLLAEDVGLIVTVDCGVTAVQEAQLCAEKGITLVITDHHECKDCLPQAAAVVNPHRQDDSYPHTNLCGVGVAFKLAAALSGDQEEMARRYCDLYCLGTIADVMPLVGENRRLVMQGLSALQRPRRLGIRALISACGCEAQEITAATVGYVLAPRINAAGRMEHAELAVQLFLSERQEEAEELAETLCRLNRERQATEYEIYQEAASLLKGRRNLDSAIVLAGENWHQGVVGIVASRLCEEYCRPTFLICLTGEKGKASSRSYGGFNLFSSLTELSPLLEGYGGHELAAGFTIRRENIEEFRRCICQMADSFAASGQAHSALEVDCEVPPSLLTLENVEGLSQMEPCGTGCVRPVFTVSEVILRSVGTVGGGKHLRLKLACRDGSELQAIYFSGGNLVRKLSVGDRLDIVFHAQINEFRGVRTVQLSVVDLRKVLPDYLYERYHSRKALSAHERGLLAPERGDIARVWHYLQLAAPSGRWLSGDVSELGHHVAAMWEAHSLRHTQICLDILQELGLVELNRYNQRFRLRIFENQRNPLENSSIYQSLRGD